MDGTLTLCLRISYVVLEKTAVSGNKRKRNVDVTYTVRENIKPVFDNTVITI